MATTTSYSNIIPTLEKIIEYNINEMNRVGTNDDSYEELLAETTKLKDAIDELKKTTEDVNFQRTENNRLTKYTSDIINKEAELTTDRLAEIKNESNNKMRLVEVNNYYGSKYNDQSEIMKIIILTCVIVLILWYINTIVQSSIFYVLIAIVVAIGCIVIFWKSYYLMLRNNIDYNQYDFDVKSSKLPNIDTSILSGSTGPSSMSYGDTGSKGCVNEVCCISPEYFSFKTGRCYASAAAAAYA
jgi:hypothetical protein